MNRAWVVAFIVSLGCALPVAGQQNLLPYDPSGGLTIEYLTAHETGWGAVTFVETIPDAQTYCAGMGAVGGPLQTKKVLWISLSARTDNYTESGGSWVGSTGANATFSAATSSGAYIFHQLLVAQNRGKKVSGIVLLPQSGWCQLWAVRMLP
jgi:hypothetical protein